MRPTRPLHRSSRSGAYAVMLGLMMAMLLAFAALAVDLSYIRIVQLQAQNAADAGAHAALVVLRHSRDEQQALDVAEEIINRSMVAGSSVTMDAASDVDFGTWDFDNREFTGSSNFSNAVEVTVRRDDSSTMGPLQLLVAPVIGQDPVNLSARAVSALRFRDIMIVLDHTASFTDEFDEARAAVTAFLDHIWNDGAPAAGDRVGMASFVGNGQLYQGLEYVEDEYKAMASDWSSNLDWCARDYSPWNHYYRGRFWHDAPRMIKCCYNNCNSASDSGTNQGAGLNVGIRELLDNGDPDALGTIVLVSDGRPQCLGSGSSACEAARSAYGLTMADYADNNGISIFSVSFNDTYNATQSAYMESLTRGYGDFYETPDESELPAILEAIAGSIPIAIVE